MTAIQRTRRDAILWGLFIVVVCIVVMMVGYVEMLESDVPTHLVPVFKIMLLLGAIPLFPGIAVAWVASKQFHSDNLSVGLTAIFIANLLFYIPLSYWVLRRGSYKNG